MSVGPPDTQSETDRPPAGATERRGSDDDDEDAAWG
jgi:hypothetical protein